MVDWKGAGIQFITVLLGSSLVLTIFNSLYSGITQPSIYIDVLYPSVDRDESLIYPIGFQSEDRENKTSHNKIVIGNNGGSAAKDLRITLYYPESDLISVKNFFANENVSWIRVDSHSWQTEDISRLSTGGRIEVNATFVNTNPDSFLQDRASCTISATYEQASKEYRCSPPSSSRFPIDPSVMIIPLIGSVLYLAIIIIPKKIKQFKKQRKERRFVSSIAKEANEVNNAFRSDINSTAIFSTRLWDSETSGVKRQIFNSYVDYNLIDSFYRELKKRDSSLFKKDISSEKPSETNIKCSDLADNVVRNVAWSNYPAQTKMHVAPIMTLPAIIVIGSLFITYFCEYSVYNLLKVQSDLYIFIFTSFIVRSIVAYFIALTIFKKLASDSADEHYSSTNLMYSQFLSKYGKMKLLILSFVVMGLPWYVIAAFITNIFGASNVHLQDFISLSIFSVIGISIDICRMAVMIYLVPRFRATVSRLYKVLALISGLSGLFFIVYALQLDYDIINRGIVSPILTSLVIGDKFYDFSSYHPSFSVVILPFFSLMGFVLIGIAQIIWALLMRSKHDNAIWHFFGVSGAAALTGMLIIGLVFVSTIVNELDPNRGDHQIFTRIYDELISVLASTPIVIVLIFLQISYIAITAIVLTREKESNTRREKIEILPGKSPPNTKIERIRQRILILISTAFLISILVSTYFGGLMLSHDIIASIDSDVPKNGTRDVLSLVANPNTNTIYALLQSSTDFPQSKPEIAVINGSTSRLDNNLTLDLNGRVIDTAFNPSTNNTHILWDQRETGRTILTISNVNTGVVNVNTGVVNNCLITTENGPLRVLTVNSKTNKTYALDHSPDKILEIDAQTCKTNPIEIQRSHTGQEDVMGLKGQEGHLTGLAVNELNNMIYVADSDLPGVYVINGTSKLVVANITSKELFGFEELEGEPLHRYLFVNPKTNLIYLLSGESVAIIDGSLNKIIKEIPFGTGISALDIDPNNGIIYVGAQNGSVYAIDGINGSIYDDVDFNRQIGQPADLAVNPEAGNIYMTTWGGDSVYLMNNLKTLVKNGTIGPFITERPDFIEADESSKSK